MRSSGRGLVVSSGSVIERATIDSNDSRRREREYVYKERERKRREGKRQRHEMGEGSCTEKTTNALKWAGVESIDPSLAPSKQSRAKQTEAASSHHGNCI